MTNFKWEVVEVLDRDNDDLEIVVTMHLHERFQVMRAATYTKDFRVKYAHNFQKLMDAQIIKLKIELALELHEEILGTIL